MHKFQAHAATDVTGFGLLGHANNLAEQQRNEVAFVIHNLPIIAKMAAISKACGNLFNLVQGTSAETSGEINTQSKYSFTREETCSNRAFTNTCWIHSDAISNLNIQFLVELWT